MIKGYHMSIVGIRKESFFFFCQKWCVKRWGVGDLRAEPPCTAISRKVVGKNVHASIPKGNMGYEQYTVPDTVVVEYTFAALLYHSQTYDHGLSCHSFKFLWRTVNSKPPTIPFGIVACTFSDNLSRNSYIKLCWVLPLLPPALRDGGLEENLNRCRFPFFQDLLFHVPMIA